MTDPSQTNRELPAIIGTNVRAARKALGLTQAQAAEKIGISSEFYARLERGRALPSVETLRRMGQELDISVDILLGSGQLAATRILEPEISPQARRVLDFVRRYPARVRLFLAVLKQQEEP